ncbi:MAG: hypothetical protein KDB48_09950 [Solirubrobacterales bacterium]|nr:hypothetical protein [Solirubrobacterales bacterium]MCB0869006.1 hypothetical protein [Solirubrobacterales bacterium]MCB8915773.1 hypothetical protein [Thermoleophilales bacterium]
MSRYRITPSLVISVIALIVALGGASYAALKIPRNSVGVAQLKKNSVSAPKLRKGSVNSAKIKDRSIRTGDLAPGVIPGATWRGERDASTLLDLTGNLQVVASTPTLPAGSYLVWSRANVLGSAGNSTIICSVASDAAQNVTISPNGLLPLSMAATKVLDQPGPIELNCNKSAGSPQVAQATVIATRVSELTAPAD